jgi:hypothetical protein
MLSEPSSNSVENTVLIAVNKAYVNTLLKKQERGWERPWQQKKSDKL